MLKALKNYSSLLILMTGILIGACLGLVLKDRAVLLKPLGDIFLNLLFTSVVPLVFFSIASAVAAMQDGRRLARIMGWMMVFFSVTGLVSSAVMIVAVHFFSPFAGGVFSLPGGVAKPAMTAGDALVHMFTTADFSDILSKKNMLALIVFAFLVGLATARSGEGGAAFSRFLKAGSTVMEGVITMIMRLAPIGLGAYFAYIVGVFGPGLMGSYIRVVELYYPVAFGYFFVAFSLYLLWAGGLACLKRFWVEIPQTALTAFATGSSVATIPVNLKAAEKIGVAAEIREVVIPVGATIHMEGSCLAAIVKIAFLFGLFHMPFSGWHAWLTAAFIAVLAGTVISGIPSGGILGEILIITLYGFPIEALPLTTMIGTIVDPPATMLNSVGDNVTCAMVSRQVSGPDWMARTGEA